MSPERHVSLDVAHLVLATFGITEPSPLYDRRVKPLGFKLYDFYDVLGESRFAFSIDWRASLPDELPVIVAAVSELGADLKVDVPHISDEGWVACGQSREWVKYVPSDHDDFTDVIIAIQKVVPSTIEFREGTGNGKMDGWEFAVLLREEWSAIEKLDRALIAEFYRPLTGPCDRGSWEFPPRA